MTPETTERDAAAKLDARSILRQKRDGGSHRPQDLRAFLAGFARGEIPDYQMSAWLMAAFQRGLNEEETFAMTLALLESGRRFEWSSLARPVADKHSTGGVGDKVSLILAPLAAACGVAVPMVAGRGLGHTGGTLDKLESIPGFRTQLAPEAMAAQLHSLGAFIVGQGPELAPADGSIYALRDVTATVEFLPFIISSIVSKKIAEGAKALAYDVKCGDGAFMKTADEARALARGLVSVTRKLGASAAALLTDMSQPTGRSIGNALEVTEAVDVLRGGGPTDTRELTLQLTAEMLALAGRESDRSAGRSLAERTLQSGQAWSLFVRLVEAQGGDPAAVEDPGRLPRAPIQVPVRAERSGVVGAIETRAMGELVVQLGGGRQRKESAVDPRIGIVLERKVGDAVEAGETLCIFHLAHEQPEVARRCAGLFKVGDRGANPPSLVLERVE